MESLRIVFLAFVGLTFISTFASAFCNCNRFGVIRNFSYSNKCGLHSVDQFKKILLYEGLGGFYKPDGRKEGKAIFALVLLLVLKSNFMSADLRNTYLCPSGPNAERELQSLVAQEPNFRCLPFGELVTKIVTAPLVFPGDPNYDPEIIKIKMIGVSK